MIACLWDIHKCPFSLASNTESIKISFSSFQNVSQNYFVKPSLPGDLSFCILHKVLIYLQGVLEY